MESGRVETPDDLRSGRPEEELLELLCDALRELYVLTSKLRLAEALIKTITVDERHEDAEKERILKDYMREIYIEFCMLVPVMVKMGECIDTSGQELIEEQSPTLSGVVAAYCRRLSDVLTMVIGYWDSAELKELRSWILFWDGIPFRLEKARAEKSLRLDIEREYEQAARRVRLRRMPAVMLNARQLFAAINTRESSVKTIYNNMYLMLMKDVLQFIMRCEECEQELLYTKGVMFDCARWAARHHDADCTPDHIVQANEAWTKHIPSSKEGKERYLGTWGTYLYRMTQYFFLLTIGDEEEDIVALVHRWSMHRMLLWYEKWISNKLTWSKILVPHNIVQTGCEIEAETKTNNAITVKQLDVYEQMFLQGLPEDSISMNNHLDYPELRRKRSFVIVSDSKMGANLYWDKPRPKYCATQGGNLRQGMAECLLAMSGYGDVVGITPVPFTAGTIKEDLENLGLPGRNRTTLHIFWSMREHFGGVVTPSETIIEEWKELTDWCAERGHFPYITINATAARLLDTEGEQLALYQMCKSIEENAKGKAIVDCGRVFWRAFYHAQETCYTTNFVRLYDKTILRQRVLLDLLPTKLNWEEMQGMSWEMLQRHVDSNKSQTGDVHASSKNHKSEKHYEVSGPEPTGDQSETVEAGSDTSKTPQQHVPQRRDVGWHFRWTEAQGHIKEVRHIKTYGMTYERRRALGELYERCVIVRQPQGLINFINQRLDIFGRRFEHYFEVVQPSNIDDDDPNGSVILNEDFRFNREAFTFKWLNAPKYAKLPKHSFGCSDRCVRNTKWIRGWQGCHPAVLFDIILEGNLRRDHPDPASAVRMQSDERRQQASIDVPWVPIFADGSFLRLTWETRTDANAAVANMRDPTGVILGREQSTHLWALHIEVSLYDMIRDGELFQREWDARLEVVPRRLNELWTAWGETQQARAREAAARPDGGIEPPCATSSSSSHQRRADH